MSTEDILALQASLALLSITCYPTQLSNVDQVLKFSADLLEKRAYVHFFKSLSHQLLFAFIQPTTEFY
jgi:hypothetical protein